MPGRRKKNFKSFRDVAKEGAMHFEVGHRSQKDPLLADTEASEHVLVPRELGTRDRDQRWEEQMKYGIYYEDEYDYLQHLRDVKEIHDSEMNQLPGFHLKEDYDDDGAMSVSMASTTASRLTIPSSVLGSVVERDVGLLEMQAAESKEDWDPEVLAALDDNFDFEDPSNCLDDDFILKANADAELIDEDDEDEEGEETEDEEGEETESADEEEDEEIVKQSDEKVKGVSEWIQRMQLEKKCAGDDDNDEGSDFGSQGMVCDAGDGLEFSMEHKAQQVSKFSAAMKPRNENLQLIDQMHEQLLKREYTEDQVGALDGERVGGHGTFDSELWKQVERDFYKSQETFTMKDVFNSEEKVRPVLPEKFYYVEDKDYTAEEEIDYSQQPLSATKEPEYNIDTIRSTYPRNRFQPAQLEHPAHLQPEKKTRKGSESTWSQVTGSEVSQAPGLTLKEVNRLERMERLADAPSTFRPKDETPDERKERKRQVKEMRKERREEKSLNKAAYKSEERRQKKQNEVRTNQKRTIHSF